MTTPEFSSRQAEVAHARAARAAAQRDASLAGDRRRSARAALDLLARRAAPDDRAAARERARLEAIAARADADLAATRGVLEQAGAASLAALDAFATFTDPRRNVAQLDDRSPFCLFPVRIETRFATVGAGPAPQHQLWVRIYPDDASIDTFEPTPTAAELEHIKRYWQDLWSAGGMEPQERAAWRALATAHGTGRAAWLVDNFPPEALPARRTKAKPADIILVIPTTTPLLAAEAAAISAYWQATWLADGDAIPAQAARVTLDAAVGAARAVELVRDYAPYNLGDKPARPATKADVGLATGFIAFPADPPTRRHSWSQAPRVNHLADRFVVLGYNGAEQTLEAIGGVVALPLIVGPDPSADPSETIHADGADLFVPDELQWLVDFDRAVAAGMGLKIDLTPAQARAGFDRLLVLGLELSAGDAVGKVALEELLGQHHHGRSGLAIVPQGTPTHNTTGAGTGYTPFDDPDRSFDDRKHLPLFTPTPDPSLKRDGQWVAELLGIDPGLFLTVHGADGQDQLQARAMNRALWPATLGYWMDKMMSPVFGDEAVERTRLYFTEHVSGRGASPALRIGGQPYGILPTTAFSQIRWLDPQPARQQDPERGFLGRLLGLLRQVDLDWKALSEGVSHVGPTGDAHKTLLDILGLHPDSAEFHSRYAESLAEIYNIINLGGLGPGFWQALLALGLEGAGQALLTRLGYGAAQRPDILQHVFMKDAGLIPNVVDDRPTSESDPLRPVTADGRNYLRWLVDAARASLDALYQEQGFAAGQTPENLLYLFLRHALTLGYYDTSYDLHRAAGFLSSAELLALKPEPTFVHVADAVVASESRFALLYKSESRITSSPTLAVTDYITANLSILGDMARLNEQIASLELLDGAPTAALQRAFAEHVDCCGYRLDAWLLGLVRYQLQAMRSGGDGQDARTGVYLGAYAWVENLRPSTTPLQPARLPDDLQAAFGPGASPLATDPTNGGYIHAPSLTHAKTAAVLRAGYLANATPEHPEMMAVNLSSDRVRLALSILEGIRNGQSLSALLGYRFERGLHDAHGPIEVDRFILPLRKAFPLAADHIATTQTGPGVSIDAIEARNVIDGLKLVAQIRTSGVTAYPFGAALPAADAAEAKAIGAEANALVDVYDAIADLALAEGVHQAVQGNFERIAATLNAYSTGHFPPEPEVIQTPTTGIGLTHRVAVHFPVGLASPAGTTPRSTAEPALDAWLSSLLPPLGTIGCKVTWTDPVGGASRERAVSLADLAVRPIDVIHLIKPDDVQAMTELDDRILDFVHAATAPRPDAPLHILYMTAAPGLISAFEASALVRSLKSLVDRSRPLRATDAMLHNDATTEQDAAVAVDRARIAGPAADLGTVLADIQTFLATLGPLAADPVANRAALVAGIDGFLDDAASLLGRSARFNVPLSGWGFARAWKQSAFADLVAALRDRAALWGTRLADFDAQVAAYDALPPATPDEDRFVLLRRAEALVTAQPDPPPPLPATLRSALDSRRATFATRRAQLTALRDTADPSLANALAAAASIAVTDVDSQSLDLIPLQDRAVVCAVDLSTNLAGHAASITARLAAVQVQLDAHDAAPTAPTRADALAAAARALLGEEFRIYPEFSPTPAQADEWANALAQSTSGALTQHLTTTLQVDFPVDEWLYGVARVRPNMGSWEEAVMLAGAFGRPVPALIPAQFPFETGAPWLALPYPPAYVLDSDRLLYTAQYATPFDPTARQCGLLVDEWTEVIPVRDRDTGYPTHDTGLTFHYDRPNNEAPQALLLVTPASAAGAWQWDDLVGALNETLDLAKKRAVEPVHLDNTPYSRFLPATVMAATYYGISIATSLMAANGVYRNIEARAHA